MIPPATVRRLATFYPAARGAFTLLSPAQADGLPIGHAGMFKPSRRALWPLLWND